MRNRLVAVLLAATALTAVGFGMSGATFTAGSANPGNDFATATSFSTVAVVDPGTPLRGTVSVSATTTGTIVSVTIQRSPAGAGTWTDICTDSSSPYSCSFDTTAVADGLYDLRATADDGAGTITSSTIANRRVDNTNPTATMTDPGSPLSGTISLGATASDGGSGVASVTIQRSPAGAGTWTDICTDSSSPYSCSLDTTSLGDALYDFRAVATDNAGNANSSTVSNRRIDNVAPTVSLTDPGANLAGSSITLDATASDGGGIANVKIQRSPAGAGTWTDICTDSSSPYSCSFDTTAVSDGLYDLRAVATDNGNRTTNSTVVANRRVDNTNPTATMTDPGSPLSGTISLGATASDGGSGISSVSIQISPAGAGTWSTVCTDASSPYGCTLDSTANTDGLYDFRAVTTDNAGNPNTSTTVANRRIDNTAPTASLTDPGSPLRGTVTLNATGTDGGSGVLNVHIDRAPAGTGTWTTICTDATSPYSCSWNTTGVADGSYDLRAVTTDNAGNVTSSTTVSNRVVDNTAPTATDIQTANTSGGTVGKAEQGDTIVFTFSEQIAPGTIVAGWNGTGTQTVTVTLDSAAFSLTGATLVTTSVTLPAGYTSPANKTVVFSNSTIAQSGNVLTVTLGAPDKPQWVGTGSAGQMSWPVVAGLTDIAGNTLVTPVTKLETGGSDAEF